MSDDFLNEISEAVSSSQSGNSDNDIDTSSEPVGDKVVTQLENTNSEDAKSRIEKDALALMGDTDDEPDYTKNKKSQAEIDKNKKETPEQLDTKKKIEEAALGDDKTKQKDDKRINPLDVFYKEDQKGNLVLADGTVIAATGKSRQIFESMKKEGRTQREEAQKLAIGNIQVIEAAKKLYAENQQLKQNKTPDLVTTTGLAQKDIDFGIDLMKEYSQSPISAIKKLLTNAQMNGIDLSEIGTKGSIDPATVQQMINNAIKENIAPMAQSSEQERADREAIKEAEKFLTEFPDARNHQNLIAQAREKFPDMSYGEIWLRLKLELDKIEPTDDNVVTDNKQQEKPVSRFKRPDPQTSPQKPQFQRKDPTLMSFAEIAQEIEREQSNG